MSSQQSLRDVANADLARLKTAHPAFFGPNKAFRQFLIAVTIIIAIAFYAMYRLDFSLTAILKGLSTLGRLMSLMIPDSGGHAVTYILSLFETLAIAYLGTLLGAILAFPMGFLAAKNVIPNFFAHQLFRRFLDTIRGVDTLIWALLWVSVVGLGPFAGVLAIACSDFGSFGKLFSETIETADRKPIEGVLSSGGSTLAGHRFGILPQIIPVIASQVLYFFESNTRSATIIGIVGAGGIGVHLSEQIRVLEMGQVAFMVVLILIAVTAIDFVSSKIRFAIIGQPST